MDPNRLHILPALTYEKYLAVIQRSWVHVYWSVPFILSWSLMESLASGCCVVASATPPVEEMIQSGKQGLLVNFFDSDALAQQVDRLLQDHEQRNQIGLRARQHILEGGYDLRTCLQQQLKLVDELMAS